LIEQVLRQCDGVQLKAADRLGINRNTLHKKREEFAGEDTKSDTDNSAPDTQSGDPVRQRSVSSPS